MSVPTVTHEMLLRELQLMRADLHQRIDHLDRVLRNGDGVLVRMARLSERTETNADAIGRAFQGVQALRDEVAQIDRRIVFFAGGAAAIGALCGVFVKPLLQHFF